MPVSKAMLTQVLLRLRVSVGDGIIAGLFLAIWINPHLFSVPFIAGVMGTLGIEATLAFIGIILFAVSKGGLSKTQFFLVASVPLFMALSIVSGIATEAHSLWIYLYFVWLTGNRFFGLFRKGAIAKEVADEVFGAGLLAGIGLMLCSVTLLLPSPPLGYNAAAVKSLGLPVFDAKQPHSILLLGFVFYAIRTVLKLMIREDTEAEAEAEAKAKKEKLIRF